LVNDKNKQSIAAFAHNLKTTGIYDNLDIKKLKNVSAKDLLVLTVIHYLSDLNQFDMKLMDYCLTNGATTESMLVLLMLNDISSIRVFCKTQNFSANVSYTVETLKKMSALHKLQNDF
jgi:hypothetical protein